MSWLLDTLAGWRLKAAALGAALLVVLAGMVRSYRAGLRHAAQEADRRRIEAMRRKGQIDDEIDTLGHADIDRRWCEWMRDRKR
jgi:anthranilate phosphoribosyltransferase